MPSVSVLVLAAVAAFGRPAAAAPEALERRELEGAHLLALAGGQLLVWNSGGAAFLRSDSGAWSSRLQLPLANLTAVLPDGPGFLAAGWEKRDVYRVVLFDRNAIEVHRWSVPELVFGLFVDGPRRWVAGDGGLMELRPDGDTGAPEPYPEDLRPGARTTPRVIQHAGTRWVCYGADLSMEHHAPAKCQSMTGRVWKMPGAGMEAAVACGDWVVTQEGPGLRELVVRSFDGEIVGRRRYASVPAFACADPQTLAVGARDVELLQLPRLTPRWTRRAIGGGARAVAAVPGAVAYAVKTSGEVIVVPR
jgi:hypothetical protein